MKIVREPRKPRKPPRLPLPDAEPAMAGEEWLRALLENSSDMVQVVGPDGTLRYVSPAMKRLLGYDPAAPLGDSAFRIVHPEDRPAVESAFTAIMRKPGAAATVQCRCRHRDGSWRHIEAAAKNNLDNPAIRGIILNIRDITETLRAQTQVAESEEKFRSVTEQSHDGITIIDNTGTIILFNPAQERIAGIAAREALGKKIWDVQYRFMTPELRARHPYRRFVRTYRTFLATGKSPWLERIVEVEVVRPDRTRTIVQTVVFPIRLSTGLVYGSVNRDVTGQRTIEQALETKERELKEHNVLLQQKNVALRELMGQIEEEKKRVEERVQANIDHLVMPVLARLLVRSSETDRVYLRMLEENLREITAGFATGISRALYRLTEKEIGICEMIRQGLSTKEIAGALCISPRTVDTRRNRIRKKLGITSPSINLSTYLKGGMRSGETPDASIPGRQPLIA